MIKTIVITMTAMLVGAIIGNRWTGIDPPKPAASELLSRLELIEQRLDYEISAREKLEQVVEYEQRLHHELSEQISELKSNDQNPAETDDSFYSRSAGTSYNDIFQMQVNNLTEAGFSLEDAQRIADLEAGIQQTIMTARYENRSINPRDLVLDFQNTLRSELGDDQYALYLESKGRPTNVEVAEVMESSAGKLAGLESGDKILSYDGERVFSILDLQRLTQEGTEGQTVVMEIDRDGIPITLAIPRGQIGISSGDFGMRNRRSN